MKSKITLKLVVQIVIFLFILVKSNYLSAYNPKLNEKIHAIIINFPHFSNYANVEPYITLSLQNFTENQNTFEIVQKITNSGGYVKYLNNLTTSQILCVLPTSENEAKELAIKLLNELKNILNSSLYNMNDNYFYYKKPINLLKVYIYRKVNSPNRSNRPHVYVTNTLAKYKNEFEIILEDIYLYKVKTKEELSGKIEKSEINFYANIPEQESKQNISESNNEDNNAYKYCILEWQNIDNYLQIFLSAKFLGECFINLTPSNSVTNYEIWSFDKDLILVLECKTAFNNLGEAENFINEFIANLEKIAICKEQWEQFCIKSHNIIMNDLLDFEKAILTKAWLDFQKITIKVDDPKLYKLVIPTKANFVKFVPKNCVNIVISDDISNPIFVAYSDTNEIFSDIFYKQTYSNINYLNTEEDNFLVKIREVSMLNSYKPTSEYASAPVYILYAIKTPNFPLFSQVLMKKQKNNLQEVINSDLEFDEKLNFTTWHIHTNYENIIIVNSEVQKILFDVYYEYHKNLNAKSPTISFSDFYKIFIVVYSPIEPYITYYKIKKGWQLYNKNVQNNRLLLLKDLSNNEKDELIKVLIDDYSNSTENNKIDKQDKNYSKFRVKLANFINRSKFIVRLLANNISPILLYEILKLER